MADEQPVDEASVYGDVSSHDVRLRRLTDLQAANNRMLQELARDGAQVDTGRALADMRIRELTLRLLGPDEILDFAVTERLSEALQETESQVRRAKLTAAPSPSPLRRMVN